MYIRTCVHVQYTFLCMFVGGFLEVLLSLVKHKNQIVVQSAVAVTAQLLQDHQTDTLPGFFLNDVCVCVKKVVISAKDLQLLGNLFSEH